VISASRAIVNDPASVRHSRSKWRAASAEGVPPPKNTELNRSPAAAGARRAASRSSAAR